MTREEIIRMAREAGLAYGSDEKPLGSVTRFAALVAAHERKAFIEILETYRIPVGNSRSGELACEWNVRTAKEKNT